MASDLREIDNRLWKTADQLRANAGLMPSEYSRPVLGLLFLRYAEAKFAAAEKELKPQAGNRRTIGPSAYQAKGVIYLPPEARYSRLLTLPEDENLGKALNGAMKAIEDANEHLKDVLPRSYAALPNSVLVELLKELHGLNIEGDAFGQVYEYFMGSFAMQTMQKGGEFYTPASIVKLIVEIIEPFKGKILDPACGSGGMFVHSAEFVRNHEKSPERELSIHGTELIRETLRMAKMNLAVHGLAADIRETNAMYEDPFDATGTFDFVMANPPFNVSGVDKDKLAKKADRFPFGVPNTDNANYLWIQLFHSALNDTGRAGFVMANSAGDARGSEQVIRQKLIESGAVDVIVSVGPNFFYTVTLPCTLWFLDKGKTKGKRAGEILFIDARHIFHQIDRAHRDFLPQQVEFLANIVRLWRGEELELICGSYSVLTENGLSNGYANVTGLCKVATHSEVRNQDWSLNPGRYIGSTVRNSEDIDFTKQIETLSEELEFLNIQSQELEKKISDNMALVLDRDMA